MDNSGRSLFPVLSTPAALATRPLDILAVGSLVYEETIKVPKWPSWGGQETVPILSHTITAGGCATNVTIFAGRMGGKCALVSTAGDGKFGRLVVDELARSNVELRHLRIVAGSEGNLVLMITNPQGDWTVMDGIDKRVRLRLEDIPPIEVFAKAKFLHIDSFAYLSAGTTKVVERALELGKQASCLVSVDGCVPAAKAKPKYMASLFWRADVVHANLFEACTATGCQTMEEAIRAFQEKGVPVSVLKDGERGSYVVTPENVDKVPAFPVKVVDTVGAGDAYVAAMLLSLGRGESLHKSALRGSAAGAMACLGSGSTSSYFSLIDVDALIERDHPAE